MLRIGTIKDNDWQSVRQAFQKLSSCVLGTESTPTVSGISLTGLTASKLISTNANKTLTSTDLNSWVTGTSGLITVTDDGDGTITLNLSDLTDPGGDRIPFWDETSNKITWASVIGNGLTLYGTSLYWSWLNMEDLSTSPANNSMLLFKGAEGGVNWEDGATLRSSIGLEIGADIQAYDAGLDSLAGLTYVSDSFIKVTAEDTYVIRTIAETKEDLALNLVENTAVSTWAGSANITTVGALASGSIAAGFTEIATDYTAAKCTDATADNTAGNETSHADVLVDGDFASAGLMYTDGAGAYSIKAIGTDVQAYHANLAAIVAGNWAGANSITTLGTIATGTWEATDVGIAHGGTGQSTAQAAINALTSVGAATNEHVLTKDTGTGNAIWKAATGADAFTVKIDAAAAAGYIGAASNDGVLRVTTTNGLTYTDGGDFITLAFDADYADISGNDESTDVTGAELEELTDGSVTSLHTHASGCSVYRDTSVQSIPSTTWTKVQFNTEDYDDNGEWDSSSGYDFTAASDGIYLITSTLRIDGMSADEFAYSAVYLNGNVVNIGFVSYPIAASYRPFIAYTVRLAQNDVVAIWVYHSHASNRDISTGIFESNCTITKLAD